MYSYLTDDDHIDKEAKNTKKCAIEQKIKLLDCKSRIIEQENNRIIIRSQRRFRSEAHNLFTEKINKILLSVNYDKRIQTSNGVATYLLVYGCCIESLEYTNM